MPSANPTESHNSTRREFIAQLGGALAVSVLAPPKAVAAGSPVGAGPAIPDDPLYTSTTRLVGLIRTGKISSVELVTAYLARIDAVNPKTNAIVQICRERALAEARECDRQLAAGQAKGRLHGVPMTIKDSFDTEGVITTAGTWGRRAFIPSRDSTIVQRARAEGAILLGKTNTPEFTLSTITDNRVYGRTLNPYKLTHTTGGSSGGAAASVSSGCSPFDIGSDSAGSIRWPSHYCGIAGLKPTQGRVPRTGHTPSFGGMFDSLQQVGPLARWVEDLAYLLPILSGPDEIDPSIVPVAHGDPYAVNLGALRVAWYTNNGSETPPTPETVAAVTEAARLMASLGATVTEDAPVALLRACNDARSAIQRGDGSAWIDRMAAKAGTDADHLMVRRGGQAVPTGKFTELLEQLDASRSDLLGWFKSYDLIVCPVNATPAQPFPAPGERPPASSAGKNYAFTGVFNNTGWPAAVVRGGTSPDGLPIGVQFVGHPWKEHIVIAAAAALERRTGGWRPPALV